MRRRMDPQGRAELVETLFFEPPNKAAKLASFWVMMVLATGIASFAVIQDSTAVVIGAMLVAPLMTPIMGVSAAAVNGWPQRLFRSLVLVVVAALAAVALAWLIASWLPSVGRSEHQQPDHIPGGTLPARFLHSRVCGFGGRVRDSGSTGVEFVVGGRHRGGVGSSAVRCRHNPRTR